MLELPGLRGCIGALGLRWLLLRRLQRVVWQRHQHWCQGCCCEAPARSQRCTEQVPGQRGCNPGGGVQASARVSVGGCRRHRRRAASRTHAPPQPAQHARLPLHQQRHHQRASRRRQEPEPSILLSATQWSRPAARPGVQVCHQVVPPAGCGHRGGQGNAMGERNGWARHEAFVAPSCVYVVPCSMTWYHATTPAGPWCRVIATPQSARTAAQ